MWTTTTTCQAAAQEPGLTSSVPRTLTNSPVDIAGRLLRTLASSYLQCDVRNTDPDLGYSTAHLCRQFIDGFQSYRLDTGIEKQTFAFSFEVKSTPNCLATMAAVLSCPLCLQLQPQRFSSSAPLISTSCFHLDLDV